MVRERKKLDRPKTDTFMRLKVKKTVDSMAEGTEAKVKT